MNLNVQVHNPHLPDPDPLFHGDTLQSVPTGIEVCPHPKAALSLPPVTLSFPDSHSSGLSPDKGLLCFRVLLAAPVLMGAPALLSSTSLLAPHLSGACDLGHIIP